MLNLLKEYLNNDEKLARWAFLELGLTGAGARDRMGKPKQFCTLDLQSEYLIENDIVGMRYLKGEIHNFYFV